MRCSKGHVTYKALKNIMPMSLLDDDAKGLFSIFC